VRRRALIAIVLCLLVGLAVAANYGPLGHYLDARFRLEKRTAEVAALEAHNAELQTQLSRLLQPGYLEELARQELTYALPGEDLYIVTGENPSPTESVAVGDIGIGGVAPASDSRGTTAVSNSATGVESAEETPSTDSLGGRPGFLERLLSRVADLF
jgi:cell division protein FtsB